MGLKIKIGADTTELRQGLKEADNSIRSFEHTGSSALSKLGSALGVDVKQVKELGAVFQGAGAKIAKSMGKGNDAVIKIGTSMKAVGGIAGAVISGIAIAWKSAKTAADNYYRTMEGQRSKAGLDAYIATLSAALSTMTNELTGGEQISFFEKVKKKWAEVTSMASNYISLVLSGHNSAMASVETGLVGLTAKTAAEKAQAISKEIFNLELQRSANLVKISELNVKINNARLESRNTLLSLAEQQKAQDEAVSAMNEKLQLQVGLEQKIVNKKKELLAIPGSSREDIMEVDAMEANINSLKAAYYSEMRKMQENGRRLLKEWSTAPVVDLSSGIKESLEATLEATDKELFTTIAEEIAQGWENIQYICDPIVKAIDEEFFTIIAEEITQGWENIQQICAADPITAPVVDLSSGIKESLEATAEEMTQGWENIQQICAADPITAPVVDLSSGIKESLEATAEEMTQGWENIQQMFADNPIVIPLIVDKKKVEMDILPMLQSLGESISYSIGEMVGNLVNGEDAWGHFANAALSALGDMAISVGKLAISTGIATEGIKASLSTLNGLVAIAAGVALIALGAAVKTSAANIASGNYSGSSVSSNYNSYAQSGSFADFYERSLEIVVTGEIVAEGSQLKAIITNEDKRNRRVT